MLIVVVVLALLATLALPAYQGYVQKTQRRQAVQMLMDLQARQGQFYTENRIYSDALVSASQNIALGDSMKYSVDILPGSTGDMRSYVLRAAPLQPNDPCGELRLDDSGKRTSERGGAECWE
jgi:type IV pilus assembly protein PilE